MSNTSIGGTLPQSWITLQTSSYLATFGLAQLYLGNNPGLHGQLPASWGEQPAGPVQAALWSCLTTPWLSRAEPRLRSGSLLVCQPLL